MDRHTRLRFNTQIYEEASAWFVECRAGDLDEAARRDFDRWLRKSPEHLSAYLEVAAIWNEGQSLDPSNRWDTDALIAQAGAAEDNLIALSLLRPRSTAAPDESLWPSPTRFDEAAAAASNATANPRATLAAELRPTVPAVPHSRGHLRTYWLAAAATGLIALAGSMFAWWIAQRDVYATAIGEQRSIALADGSTVEMDSKSEIRVRYSKSKRTVDLLGGQALFHVAKDAARPFIVSAHGTRVRAVGTRFDVYERRGGTVVTVLEGQVAVLAPPSGVDAQSTRGPQVGPAAGGEVTSLVAGDSGNILVSAGEQLTVTPELARKSQHANIAAAMAWTERRIVFESATLSEVAEEFNRYNKRQLVIEDPQLYDFHISGVFSSADPESLIRFLRERPGVRVTETTAEVRVSKNI